MWAKNGAFANFPTPLIFSFPTTFKLLFATVTDHPFLRLTVKALLEVKTAKIAWNIFQMQKHTGIIFEPLTSTYET
jgi:hypothetical protein